MYFRVTVVVCHTLKNSGLKSFMKIIVGVHEGFVNVPALYGSDVRDTGEVTDFRTGMIKAGKVRHLHYLRAFM